MNLIHDLNSVLLNDVAIWPTLAGIFEASMTLR
jgi:hypothetical protein